MSINLSILSSNISSNASWQATLNEQGLSNGILNQNSLSKRLQLGDNVGNTSSGGSDELYAQVISLNTGSTTGSTTTINLQNFTDACNQTGASFARLKYWRFHLLSTSDASIGTNASSIKVGGALSNAFPFSFNSSGSTVSINNGSIWEQADASAPGYAVNSGNNQILITNNDNTQGAVVEVVIIGGSN